MKRILGLAACSLLASQALAISINEIRVDQPGTDNDEFFELAGTPGASLSGLTYLVIGDDSGDGSGLNGKRSGSIEFALDLTGSSIPADGYFLAATSTFTGGSVDLTAGGANLFENSDNVSHLLVSGFTGALNDDLDTNNDGVLDSMPWASVVDAISLIETANPPANNADEWDYGFGGGIGPDGTFVPGHVYRFANETGPWNIGIFEGDDITPGIANLPEPASLALIALGVLALRRR
ncbi:MAG: PEP-CTERM sorting domain-containing protein [Phycisphaerae bacterium]